eukprot:g3679.t1
MNIGPQWKHSAASFRDILERLQAGLFEQIVGNVWLPPLDLMQTSVEKKIASVALTQLLFLKGVDVKLACAKLALLLGVASHTGRELRAAGAAAGGGGQQPGAGGGAAGGSSLNILPGNNNILDAGNGVLLDEADLLTGASSVSYEGSYSKLSNADAADGGDYLLRAVPDLGAYVKQQLQPHKGSLEQLAVGDEKVKQLWLFLSQGSTGR